MTINTPSSNAGIIWILIGTFLLSTMDAVAKFLVEYGFDPAQMIAIRSLIIVPLMLIVTIGSNNSHQIRFNKPIPLLLRGLFGFLAPYCFFKGLDTLSLGTATVVFFASTFMTTALSIPMLGEKVGIHRWSAVIVGFIGVFIAMNPQGAQDLTGYFWVLGSALVYSVLFLSGRKLAQTESVFAIVFSFNAMAGVVGFMISPFVWKSMDFNAIKLMVMLSVIAVVGHYCMTKAFKLSEASLLTPFEYSAILWSALLGYIFWQDIPASHVWYGCAIIILCGLYVFWRELRVSK